MKFLANFMVGLIKLYQWTLSPMLGQRCRFAPSCSQYAVEAIKKHGACCGAFYTIRRLAKCHPWHEGGHDPVP